MRIQLAGSNRSLPMRFGPAGVFAAIIGLLFVAGIGTILIALAIWPGEVKLVAPLFCDSSQPDAFIVTDTYSVRPGETTTNYTLYCMGPRGDATDVGFAGPFLATAALNLVILIALIALLSLVGAVRRRLRNRTSEPPSTPFGAPTTPFGSPPDGEPVHRGPFVD